jgi:dihydroneopterin triphosphate diphosphatase
MRVRYDVIQCYVVRAAYAGGHEFLQLRRCPEDFMGGSWTSIYGGIVEGETAWQAAKRELMEETGLTPLEFYQLDTINTFYLAKDDSVWNCPGFCAVVPAEADVQLNEEHDAFRWVAREQYLAQLLWPGERAACAELCREILDNGAAKPFLRIEPG